jgi:hypothetical protein
MAEIVGEERVIVIKTKGLGAGMAPDLLGRPRELR